MSRPFFVQQGIHTFCCHGNLIYGDIQGVAHCVGNGKSAVPWWRNWESGEQGTFSEAEEKTLVLCVGYATGASIHLACGCTVYVAFSANNLPVVANCARNHFPDKAQLICADNDEIGLSKEQEAAQTRQARLVPSSFSTGKGMDFKNLNLGEGLQEVRLKRKLDERNGSVPLSRLLRGGTAGHYA